MFPHMALEHPRLPLPAGYNKGMNPQFYDSTQWVNFHFAFDERMRLNWGSIAECGIQSHKVLLCQR
jgi:hypothetical protein